MNNKVKMKGYEMVRRRKNGAREKSSGTRERSERIDHVHIDR